MAPTHAWLLALLPGVVATVVGHATAENTYQNPVINNGSTPDPGVVFVNNVYYVAVTGTDAGGHFRIFASADLSQYRQVGHVFPTGQAGSPGWAYEDYWAPEIHPIPAAVARSQATVTYNVYFAARASANKQLSIGVASGPTVLGPFTDIGNPLVTSDDMGYIDPTFFHHDGTSYLIWKSDGNAIGKPTPIHMAQLDATGTKVEGEWTTLIHNDLPWEGVLTEAPWLVAYADRFYLFYSGNEGPDYAVGVARADNITGPYTKFGPPILHNASGAAFKLPFWGPGHCSVLPVAGTSSWAIWYHAWLGNETPTFAYPRHLMFDVVDWSSDTTDVWPAVDGGRDVPSVERHAIP